MGLFINWRAQAAAAAGGESGENLLFPAGRGLAAAETVLTREDQREGGPAGGSRRGAEAGRAPPIPGQGARSVTSRHLGESIWKALAELLDPDRGFVRPSWPDCPLQLPRLAVPVGVAGSQVPATPSEPQTGLRHGRGGRAALLRERPPGERARALGTAGRAPAGRPGLRAPAPARRGAPACPSLGVASGFAPAPPPRGQEKPEWGHSGHDHLTSPRKQGEKSLFLLIKVSTPNSPSPNPLGKMSLNRLKTSIRAEPSWGVGGVEGGGEGERGG